MGGHFRVAPPRLPVRRGKMAETPRGREGEGKGGEGEAGSSLLSPELERFLHQHPSLRVLPPGKKVTGVPAHSRVCRAQMG